MWMYKDRNEEEIHGNCLTLGSNSEFRLVVLSYSPVQCFTSMIIRILNRDTPFHFQTHHETDNLLWFGPHYWVSVREMPLYWWMQVLFRMFLYWKHAPNENFSIYIHIVRCGRGVIIFVVCHVANTRKNKRRQMVRHFLEKHKIQHQLYIHRRCGDTCQIWILKLSEDMFYFKT